MSTQQATSSKVSSSLDTSHLKVKFPFKAKYGNYINGKFVEPKSGKYFDNVSPISNEKICSVARSNDKDVEAALDAAHAAFPEWGENWHHYKIKHLEQNSGCYWKKPKLVSSSWMFR